MTDPHAPLLAAEAAEGSESSISPPRDGWSRYRRVLGWLLLGAFLVSSASVLIAGSKHESYDSLTRGLASGEVTSVEVTGLERWSPGSKGYTLVEVRWRDGIMSRWTEVIQASSRKQARQARGAGVEDGTEVVVGDVASEWRDLQPGLEIVEGSFNAGGQIGDYRTPTWMAIIAMIVGWAVIVQVIVGPQPWRVTRWGWFWLVALVPPVGVPAYLLLGGPTGLGGPGRSDSRMNGWYALLLVVLLSGPFAYVANNLLF